ncbi:hypothetical protein ACWJKU_10870 [Methylocaldum sp. MU1018]
MKVMLLSGGLATICYWLLQRFGGNTRLRKTINLRESIPVRKLAEPLANQLGYELDDIAEIWVAVSAVLRIDPEKLRTEDSLAELLSLDPWKGDLTLELEAALSESNISVEPGQTCFGEFISIICSSNLARAKLKKFRLLK